MNTLFRILNAELVYALGWTILHSFWQCALVAAMLAITLRITKKLSSNTRYLIACSALVLCCVISLVTFKSYWDLAQQARIDLVLDALHLQIKQIFNTQRAVQSWFSIMDSYLIWIVMGWFIGCVLMSVRNLLDFLMCLKLQKEGAELASPHWENTLKTLCEKVGITRKVSVRISSHLQSPCTLGHFKPLILVPVGLLSGMSQAQVEVILLHELGHIRRNDYAIGLIQMLLKIIFFFNPMALWISSVIDAERENACDDIAVDVCKDPLFFSKTLKEFAELNNTKNLSMAINDNNMHLLNRIKRQLQGRKQLSRAIEKLIASFTLLLCCATATVYAQTNSPAYNEQLQEKIETVMLKSPMFERVPESERLAAVKHFLEEFDENNFSVGVSKVVTLNNDKYPSEKVDISFFDHPLKVKVDISTDMLKAMSKLDGFLVAKENVVLFKDENNNYVIAIDKLNPSSTDKKVEDKLQLIVDDYQKSSLNNKFFAKNNMQGYSKPFQTAIGDLTFKVSYQYLFIVMSHTLIDYALSAPIIVKKGFGLEYQGKSLVPGAPYAGAERGAEGNMIITYDRKAWEQKSEWMNNNSLYSNSPAKPVQTPPAAGMDKELAESLAVLDARHKQLLLTDSQLSKLKSCFERYWGFEMPAKFSYNLQKSMIASVAQASDEDLIKLEESKNARLKKFVMGPQGKEFYVNLLDDSDKTPEDPDGLAGCKK